MKEILLEGDRYILIARAFYRGKRGSYDLNELRKWNQPIKFKNDSEILNQIYPGPCGFFAVLQAFIINSINLPIESSKEDKLVNSILDVMKIINKSYAYCHEISPKECKAKIIEFESRDEAYAYFISSEFNNHERAVLLTSISFVYLYSKTPYFALGKEPFVYDDQDTTMSFVFMLLTGRGDDGVIDEIEKNKGSGRSQEYIGIHVTKNRNTAMNRCWLNPGAKVNVVHKINHYIAYNVIEELAIVYDTLREGSSPYAIELKDFI